MAETVDNGEHRAFPGGRFSHNLGIGWISEPRGKAHHFRRLRPNGAIFTCLMAFTNRATRRIGVSVAEASPAHINLSCICTFAVRSASLISAHRDRQRIKHLYGRKRGDRSTLPSCRAAREGQHKAMDRAEWPKPSRTASFAARPMSAVFHAISVKRGKARHFRRLWPYGAIRTCLTTFASSLTR